jgi:hypothetical protein
MADAQKHVKVMQSGHALPIIVGSKLLMKVEKIECEYFNQNIFATLDDAKEMEYKCKLADPASLTSDAQYNMHGPIGLIAWSHKVHKKFVTDHEWPGIATNLPQSNNVCVQKQGGDHKVTCYGCGKEGNFSHMWG